MNRGEFADVVLASDLTGPEKLILLGYVSHQDSRFAVEEADSYPGIARLAVCAGVGEGAARRARHRLVEAGILIPADAANGQRVRCRIDPSRLTVAPTPSKTEPLPKRNPLQNERGTPSKTEGDPLHFERGTPSKLEPEPSSSTLSMDPSSENPLPGATGRKRKPRTSTPSPDAAMIYAVWRNGFHTRADPTPDDAETKYLEGSIARLAPDRVARLIRWAHLAPHDRAGFLRGPGYAPGKAGAFLSIAGLLRYDTLRQRDAWAAEWEAAGEPVAAFGEAPAPRVNGHRGVNLFDHLDDPPAPPRILIDPLTGERP